jgi:hypothetical protein
MKKIACLLTLLAMYEWASAQTYHPFPTDNATWSQIMYNWGMWGQECWGTTHYGVSGDTVIDSKTYSKFYGINGGNSNHYIDVPGFILDSAFYVGALREDSSKKVFLLFADSTDEKLIYDFGLSIGDTVYTDIYNNTACSHFVLDTVIPTNVNGTMRNEYFLHGCCGCWLQLTWIEGIGSINGWFELPYTGTFDPQLACATQNNQQVYGGAGYCSCAPVWWLSFEEKSYLASNLFPNPADKTFTITLATSEPATLTLYTTIGKPIAHQTASHSAFFDVSNLTDGVYYLSVKTDGGISNQKVVVSHR